MRVLLPLLLGGCSFTLELEGPPAFVTPGTPDLAPIEAGVPDAVVPVALDAGDAAPPPNSIEVQGPPGALIVRHSAAAADQALPTLPAEGRLRLDVVAGEWITVVIGDGTDATFLVTVAGVEPGDVIPISHPVPPIGRMTSMQLRLESPQPGADGYVASNGCVELRCEGMSCSPWFGGRERSLGVTDRCIVEGDRVRSLALALDDEGEPLAWAAADDALSVDDQQQTSFGAWQDTWWDVSLRLTTSAERVALFGRPFDGVAFGSGPGQRLRVEARAIETVIRLPADFAPHVEVGIDLLDGGDVVRDRPRQAWRSFLTQPVGQALEVALDQEVPVVPAMATLLVDEAGARPGILWLADVSPADVARVDFQWVAEGREITWIFFGPAGAGEARFPELPDAVAGLRPPPATEGTYAQLTLVRCDGVSDFQAHRRRPCPLYGAGETPAAGRTVAWSSVLAERPPPPPDAAVPDAAVADAGAPP